MSPKARAAWDFLKDLPLALLAPLLLLVSWLVLLIADLVCALRPRRSPAPSTLPATIPNTAAATIVIPNWNGRDLLAKYLPSVIDAIANSPGSEIIVVENGSGDGSAEF